MNRVPAWSRGTGGSLSLGLQYVYAYRFEHKEPAGIDMVHLAGVDITRPAGLDITKPAVLDIERSCSLPVSNRGDRCRANSAHMRQSRLECGLGLSHFLAYVCKLF